MISLYHCEAEILGKRSEQVGKDSQQSIHLAETLHTAMQKQTFNMNCMIDQILSQILIIKSSLLTFAIHKYGENILSPSLSEMLMLMY